MLSSHIYEIVFKWSCTRVCEKVVLFVILNWGIIQYHYYCELYITESELDLNYPGRALARVGPNAKPRCGAHLSSGIMMSSQSRRHGGFGGLSPQNTAPSAPKLKYETL